MQENFYQQLPCCEAQVPAEEPTPSNPVTRFHMSV
jgi:hypothetical protein